jgi:hypothetical protein
MRSRAWTPLKYPKSALEENAYFPLHEDVVLASVRELLILDGTLAPSLQVSKCKARYCTSNKEKNSVLAPRYEHHLASDTWGEPAFTDHQQHHHLTGENAALRNKRKNQSCISGSEKRIKLEDPVPPIKLESEEAGVHVLEEETPEEESDMSLFMKNDKSAETLPPCAEEIANRIVLRARIVGSENESKQQQHNKSLNTPLIADNNNDDERPPRKISVSSEHDHFSDSAPAVVEATPVTLYPAESLSEPSFDVSSFVNLAERSSDGSFTFMVPRNQLPNMLETSISSEAVLRDATLTMTTQLVQSFSDASLRLFLGYKATTIARNRLICMLAGFLFDNSHAMFAWEQTEQEYLVLRNNNQIPTQAQAAVVITGLDAVIQKSLFDDRALAKIGGFHPSSLLPHAISIARQRRRKTTWEFFATTVKGKRMLDHHTKGEASVLLVGKRRRGQRLRHRHWLTSSLLWNEHHHECEPSSSLTTTTTSTPPFNHKQQQPYPVASSFEYRDETVHQVCELSQSTRRTQLLADMPTAMSLVLKKPHPTDSWGVGLVKEGVMCVVGKVRATLSKQDRTKELVCGDLILHVRNERGEEACSPTCAVPIHPSQQGQDWFRAIVDLFRTSEELLLIVQRV